MLILAPRLRAERLLKDFLCLRGAWASRTDTGLEKHVNTQRDWKVSPTPTVGRRQEHAFVKGRYLPGPGPASEQQPTFFPLKRSR